MSLARLDAYFDRSATQFSARPALHVGDRDWTYGQLCAAKRQVAESLDSLGLTGAGEGVALLCGKTFWDYAALLGILESGNMYVPINTRWPCERIHGILQDAEPRALVVDAAAAGQAADIVQGWSGKPLVTLAGDAPDAKIHARGPAPARDSTFAYLLFTSGSTGRPKGVAVTHANACAFVEAAGAELRLRSDDRCTQFAELTFDFSVGEMFLCWAAGACVCVPSHREALLPVQFVRRRQITVWSSVPTLANNIKLVRGLVPNGFPSIRLAYFCGEALPAPLAHAWNRAAPNAAIVNFYGPTEATVFATIYRFDPASPPIEHLLPIGRPIAGVECRVMEDGGPPPVGGRSAGELLLAGPQVVPGYWRNPTATSKSFVQLAGDSCGRTWYRTGDLVSVGEGGDLLFHGRCDDQVKLRGYRVQLKEIEHVLRRVSGADQVAVVPVYSSDGLCEGIVAYCSECTAAEDDLQRRCGAQLPAYMIPRRVIALPSLPTNDNGKIDYVELSHRAAEAFRSAPASGVA